MSNGNENEDKFVAHESSRFFGWHPCYIINQANLNPSNNITFCIQLQQQTRSNLCVPKRKFAATHTNKQVGWSKYHRPLTSWVQRASAVMWCKRREEKRKRQWNPARPSCNIIQPERASVLCTLVSNTLVQFSLESPKRSYWFPMIMNEPLNWTNGPLNASTNNKRTDLLFAWRKLKFPSEFCVCLCASLDLTRANMVHCCCWRAMQL